MFYIFVSIFLVFYIFGTILLFILLYFYFIDIQVLINIFIFWYTLCIYVGNNKKKQYEYNKIEQR